LRIDNSAFAAGKDSEEDFLLMVDADSIAESCFARERWAFFSLDNADRRRAFLHRICGLLFGCSFFARGHIGVPFL
jgi:cellulose synthase/poly-beta-1,6-N-acetylglucosamine synthase-like glycosyltransferase